MYRFQFFALMLLFGIIPFSWICWQQIHITEGPRGAQLVSAIDVNTSQIVGQLKPNATPSSTPLPAADQEIIETTDYRLLQVMILLAILIVIVIFWGVWSNRDRVILR